LRLGGRMKQYDDEDLNRANWLHEHGMCVDLNMIELAERIYEQRKEQHDKGGINKPFLHGDRE
jgi:hypothetical protein